MGAGRPGHGPARASRSRRPGCAGRPPAVGSGEALAEVVEGLHQAAAAVLGRVQAAGGVEDLGEIRAAEIRHAQHAKAGLRVVVDRMHRDDVRMLEACEDLRLFPFGSRYLDGDQPASQMDLLGQVDACECAPAQLPDDPEARELISRVGEPSRGFATLSIRAPGGRKSPLVRWRTARGLRGSSVGLLASDRCRFSPGNPRRPIDILIRVGLEAESGEDALALLRGNFGDPRQSACRTPGLRLELSALALGCRRTRGPIRIIRFCRCSSRPGGRWSSPGSRVRFRMAWTSVVIPDSADRRLPGLGVPVLDWTPRAGRPIPTVFTGLVAIACSTCLYVAEPELSNRVGAIVDSHEVGPVLERPRPNS